MRLAIFLDQVFWRDGAGLSTNESYALFFRKFVDLACVDELIFIGRLSPETGRAPIVLDHQRISLIPLPYYENLYRLWAVNPRIFRRVRQLAAQNSNNWDALLIHGPHPLGQILAKSAGAAGVPVIPVLRQNLVRMMGTHAGAKRLVATLVAKVLDNDLKKVARGRTILAVGREMADEYGNTGGRVVEFMPCLVERSQFAASSTGHGKRVDPRRLITVGRLSPEKGHSILLESLAALKSRGLECHLDIVGSGPLEIELKGRVAEANLSQQVTFHGFVGYGPELFAIYEQAAIAVIASLTEGFPQVLNESLSMGLATVATRVGGIPGFLTDGETALLVPPGDAPSLATAIERLVRDDALRDRLSKNGTTLMHGHTLEANRDVVMKAIRDEIRLQKTPLGA